MNTLTRYIGREVLAAIMLIFGALVMLFAFFDLIHELGDVGKGNYTISVGVPVRRRCRCRRGCTSCSRSRR